MINERRKLLEFGKEIAFQKKKTNSKYYYNIISFLAFLLSYYFYFLSLEKCSEDWGKCSTKAAWIRKKLIQSLISIIIISLLFELIILKIISRWNLLHLLFVSTFFFNYSNGRDFNDHGHYNFLGCFIIFILFFVSFLPLNILIYLKISAKYIIINLLLLFLILYIIFFFLNKEYMSCNDWINGLNNTIIANNNSIYGCQIKIPKGCPYKIGKYFLDITKIRHITCKDRGINERINLITHSKSSFISENTTLFGFPLTNKDSICLIDNSIEFFLINYSINNVVDMNNKIILDKYFKNKLPEILVNFSNDIGNMEINLTFNETLSKEKKKKEKNSNPFSKNILIVYIDSVSRANSIRQLKKTLKFFEKFMHYQGNFNKKYPSENYHSFQFFKYHSFLYYTIGNYPILYYGNTRYQNKTLITKFLNNNGYVTGYINELCLKDNIRTYHNASKSEIYDYQYLICDPNCSRLNKNTIRCLYGKHKSEYLYEYANQFWRKYKDNRKFLNIMANDGHEGTLEALKYADDIIYNFLINLYNDNLFKDSSIFLLSDHGVAMPSIYYLNDFYKIEQSLPMLYIIINDRKNVSYGEQYKYIYENQQTFITGYDIYNTFIHLIYGNDYESLHNKSSYFKNPKSHLGVSLFNKIDAINRNTSKYKNMSHFACI